MTEELVKIIENGQNIIPFLKKLTDADKKKLVPTIKKLHKKYFVSDQSSYSKMVNVKRALIEQAGYVCFNKKDAERLLPLSQLSLKESYLQNIIPWYKPKWYSEVINEDKPWELDYEKMMQLKDKGILEPSDELIAWKLLRFNKVVEWKKSIGTSVYTPQNLLKYKETLQDHIWLLFEVESPINWEGGYGNRDFWVETFVDFSAEGKIDRNKLIQKTIGVFTKDFDKFLIGWFANLLIVLKLTPDEVLMFQDELMLGLSSSNTKVVNTVLNYLKKIANKKDFHHEVMLENSSILLNSETKSIVTSTLMIFDKMAKVQKSLQKEICLKAVEAFINSDEKIQERASKIIAKYATSDKELITEISLYVDNLYSSSKEILKDFVTYSEEVLEDNLEEVATVKKWSEPVETYETFDELLFFVSQAIDNNETYHIDLLMSYLPKINVLINSENVSKLEPILVRSFDIASDYYDWSTQRGFIEHIACFYLRDFGMYLLEKFPKELINYKNHTQNKAEEIRRHVYFKSDKDIFKPLEKQNFRRNSYSLHQSLFLRSKALIKEGLAVDLLSMPTHKPCWVSPKALVNRIIAYEKCNKEIDVLDFQIAMGRLSIFESSETILDNIKSIKNEEIRNILTYHFGFERLEKFTIENPQLWLQSVLSRNIEKELAYFKAQTRITLVKEKGVFNWECKEVEVDLGYGRKEKENHIVIDWLEDLKSLKSEILSRIKNLDFKNKKGIYNYITDISNEKELYSSAMRPHDDIKWLYLLPNNPNPLLGQFVAVNFKKSKLPFTDTTRNMLNILKGLYEIWNRPDYGEATYLIIAIAFLCSDKTARELSAELWIKTNSENTINNNLLGKVLGRLEHQEYGTLKRFTDLIMSNMFNISKKHNKNLLIVLDNMVSEMNDVPIKGVKKLLELFNELKVQFPDDEISQYTQQKLRVWKEVKSLKNLVNKILD